MLSNRAANIILSIPTDAVGLIIGKEGKTFNEISVLSRAKLTLQLHHDICKGLRQRFIIVEGDISCIAMAVRIIIEKLSTRNTGDRIDESIELIKWVVPQSKCSMIIGRGGNCIKAINAASGSWVKIAHIEETCPGENQRLLYIRGTVAQNAIALSMVRQIAGGQPFENTPTVAEELIIGEKSKIIIVSTDADSNYCFQCDMIIPFHLILPALEEHEQGNILDVDFQIDPEFRGFVDKDVKVRLLGQTVHSVDNAAKYLQDKVEKESQIISPIVENPQFTSLPFPFCDKPFMVLKMLIHHSDLSSLMKEVTSLGKTRRNSLRENFDVMLLSLPCKFPFSQTLEMHQVSILVESTTFYNKMDLILDLLCTDLEVFKAPIVNTILAPPNKKNSYLNNSQDFMYPYSAVHAQNFQPNEMMYQNDARSRQPVDSRPPKFHEGHNYERNIRHSNNPYLASQSLYQPDSFSRNPNFEYNTSAGIFHNNGFNNPVDSNNRHISTAEMPQYRYNNGNGNFPKYSYETSSNINLHNIPRDYNFSKPSILMNSDTYRRSHHPPHEAPTNYGMSRDYQPQSTNQHYVQNKDSYFVEHDLKKLNKSTSNEIYKPQPSQHFVADVVKHKNDVDSGSSSFSNMYSQFISAHENIFSDTYNNF